MIMEASVAVATVGKKKRNAVSIKKAAADASNHNFKTLLLHPWE
jgi:hypothetical protein